MQLRHSTRLLLVPVSILLLSSLSRAQGSNSCATPQVISGPGPHAFDTSGATTGAEGQGYAACNFLGSTAIENDVWFRWTAGAAGTYLLTTCLQTSVDTKVAVYGGTVCPAAPPVACDDDTGGVQSVARINASAGQTFVFQIGNAPFGAAGTGTFRVLPVALGPLDECSATQLVSSTGLTAFDVTVASDGTQGQTCITVHNDIWYRWTAPSAGMAHLTTCGQTNADTAISVYSGSGCPASAALACDDDGCNIQSILQWPAAAGATYTIQIGLGGGIAATWGTFQLTLDPPPANDNCATPEILPAGPAGANYDNSTATTGAQGQGSFCGAIQRDLWYTWTASVNGTATVETCFTTAANTILAVYNGTGCPAAAALTCNDDACGGEQSQAIFPISAGASYTIQVGTPPGFPPGPAAFTVLETDSGPMTGFCYPNASGIRSCPCGNQPVPNDGTRGCNNFGPNPPGGSGGAILTATGNATASTANTLVFHVTDMQTPSTVVVLFAGSAQLSPGVQSGGGVRCVAGLQTPRPYKSGPGFNASSIDFPSGSAVPPQDAWTRSNSPGPGTTKHYYAAYRNSQAGAACGNPNLGFNLTNAGSVTWGP